MQLFDASGETKLLKMSRGKNLRVHIFISGYWQKKVSCDRKLEIDSRHFYLKEVNIF